MLERKIFFFFFSKPLFTQKEKLNLKTYNSTLLDIYGISVREKRSKLTKFFYKNSQKREEKEKLEAKAAYCTEQIMNAKNDYTQRMNNKLNDPKAAPKTYWSILTKFLYNKKIPAIPPLLVNGKFVSDFFAKANLFNNFFASIYTPINNGSRMLPSAYKTNVRINSFRINHNDI